MMNVYAARLQDWQRQGLERPHRPVQSPQGPTLSVDDRAYLAFCSNDYLGLANDPRVCAAAQKGLEQYGIGAGASALVCGYSAAQAELEAWIAHWLDLERVLLFSSGYLAHLGVIPVLVDGESAVFSDALNHASLIDGVRLARPAQLTIYPHGDWEFLEEALRRCPREQRWILTDGVFSMDGDVAPLRELERLAEQYGAWVLVDDAHGLGVLGPQGKGSLAACGVSSERVLHMATFGKAVGTAGAFVGGAAPLIDWLAQRARTHMFSTALPPLVQAATRVALECVALEEFRRTHLARLGERLDAGLQALGLKGLPSCTAIHPLILGENRRVMAVSDRLREEGLWVAAIRPPSVPEGTARLRISLSAAHSVAHIDQLLEGLEKVMGVEA